MMNGFAHLVKDHANTKREICYTFQLTAGDLYTHQLKDTVVHTMACVTPVVEPWVE